MENQKLCRNFRQTGFCRFGHKCKYQHVQEETEVLFSRLTLGNRKTNQNVQVHLESSTREELRKLLLNTSFESKNTEEVINEESSSLSVDSDSDEVTSDQSYIEREFEKKYGHLPDSTFRQKFKLNFLANNKVDRANCSILKSSIVRDSKLDFNLQEEFNRLIKKSMKYRELLEFRRRLPAFERKYDILDLIEHNQVCVISGETGCGKTTQVSQFILDDFILKNKGSLCHIVCTQPRRISAISVAERVAAERGDACGGDNSSVGYQIRLQKSLPRKQGSIIFCTTGILLQWMQTDPGLTTISHVIIDEIHERDISSDFAMTVIRELLPQRPDLRVILMSATLNSVQFSNYFGKCPSLDIKGHLHPVDVYFLEHVLNFTSYVRPDFLKKRRNPQHTVERQQEFHNFIVPYVSALKYMFSEVILNQLLMPESEQTDLELIRELIEYICSKKGDGAILIFLPGWDQIAELVRKINESEFFCQFGRKKENVSSKDELSYQNNEDEAGLEEVQNDIIVGYGGKFLILPLHSKMPTVNQSVVFDRPPEGVRKIIVATNIAETSITIDDVVFIIDSGKMKVKNYDVEKNISTLLDEWVSQANATQRRGRAGRVQRGECYHLYTKARFDSLKKYPRPEMLRIRLEDLILHIKILQLGKVVPLLKRAMDCPDVKTITSSLKFLQTLKALDEDENLTPLGYHLARLPLDPQIGKMIIMGAIFSCVDPVFSIAASLSEKTPFYIPLHKEKEATEIKLKLSEGTKSDHLICAIAIKQWEEAKNTKASRKFCREHFLSPSILWTLKELKSEFAETLQEMGFLSSKYSKDPAANLHSENLSVVKAVICAGLYPNVAIVERVEFLKHFGKISVHVETPEDGEVKLHRVTVNESAKSFESPYLMYHKKLKSSKIFIHDTTMISSLPLIIFGHKFRRGQREIMVNDSVTFRCEEAVSILVESLRLETNQILDKKILNPGTIDWTSNDHETKMLRSLIQLITAEDERILPKPLPKPKEAKSKNQNK